jgi:hypothetical protein
MNKGTVKWYNSRRGYGFIQPVGGGKDMFVHATGLSDPVSAYSAKVRKSSTNCRQTGAPIRLPR